MEDGGCHDVPRPAGRRSDCLPSHNVFVFLLFLLFSDKEKQTMTPGSLFGSGEGHTDCTSERRDMVLRVL